MTELRELIERLEKLEGPDREVDAAIGCHLGLNRHKEHNGEAVYGREYPDGWSYPALGYDRFMLVEPYSASLDAAIALCELVLPGCWRMSGKAKASYFAEIRLYSKGAEHKRFEALSAANDAIALLLATLKALESQGPENSR